MFVNFSDGNHKETDGALKLVYQFNKKSKALIKSYCVVLDSALVVRGKASSTTLLQKHSVCVINSITVVCCCNQKTTGSFES